LKYLYVPNQGKSASQRLCALRKLKYALNRHYLSRIYDLEILLLSLYNELNIIFINITTYSWHFMDHMYLILLLKWISKDLWMNWIVFRLSMVSHDMIQLHSIWRWQFSIVIKSLIYLNSPLANFRYSQWLIFPYLLNYIRFNDNRIAFIEERSFINLLYPE
jgi:hypothetical protein